MWRNYREEKDIGAAMLASFPVADSMESRNLSFFGQPRISRVNLLSPFQIRDRAHSTHARFWDFLTPSPPCTLHKFTSMAGPPLPPSMRAYYLHGPYADSKP